MNYIYDILLNFSNEELYEFFEWEKDDCLDHIRRIPLIKVSSLDFYNLRNNIVKVDEDFLALIKNKAEMFQNRYVKVLKYACIFTNGMDAFAIRFKNNGVSLSRSMMLIDENEEVLEFSGRLKERDVVYSIVGNLSLDHPNTRQERRKIHYLKQEIEGLYQANNFDKLRYLYYEWHNERRDDIEGIYVSLRECLSNDWSVKHNQLYDLIKLSHLKNP